MFLTLIPMRFAIRIDLSRGRGATVAEGPNLIRVKTGTRCRRRARDRSATHGIALDIAFLHGQILLEGRIACLGAVGRKSDAWATLPHDADIETKPQVLSASSTALP